MNYVVIWTYRTPVVNSVHTQEFSGDDAHIKAVDLARSLQASDLTDRINIHGPGGVECFPTR